MHERHATDCCFCGRPITSEQPCDSLPAGTLTIHVECLGRDGAMSGDPFRVKDLPHEELSRAA